MEYTKPRFYPRSFLSVKSNPNLKPSDHGVVVGPIPVTSELYKPSLFHFLLFTYSPSKLNCSDFSGGHYSCEPTFANNSLKTKLHALTSEQLSPAFSVSLQNRHLVIETSQEVSDVPYADYFTAEGLWDVKKDAEKSDACCVLRVYVNVAFSRKTMWKGKIEQSTMEECREAYATWIHLAHELLKQKKTEKTEGSTGNVVVPDDQIDKESKGVPGEHSERLQANAEAGSINDAVTNASANHEQSGNLLDGNLPGPTTSPSSPRASTVKFCTNLKRFGNLQMVLVVGFSLILLLMQLSIVLLLSRPHQVYVVPQASRLSSMDPSGGQRATGALHWLEKRMHLLKDEVLVVESQLERMRNEYLLLKAQYNDLECRYPQQT